MLSGCDEPAATLEFSVPDLQNEHAVLDSRRLELPAIVNVWASWCLPCRREHPHLSRLSSTGPLPLYGLNFRDDPADARRWLDFYGNPYAAIGDDRGGVALGAYSALGLPQTFVLDVHGNIRFHHVGAISEATVSERLLPLIEQIVQEE